MKKVILYLVAVVALASAPLVNLFARASHGDWYFREEWGGTQYSAYGMGNGKVHYKILVYATGDSKNFWAYSNEEQVNSTSSNVDHGSRCWTHLEGAGDYPNFLIYEADNAEHNRPSGDGGKNPNDRGWVRLKVLSGSIIVTNTYDGEPDYVTADGKWHEFWLKRMGTADWLTYLEFDWIEPAEYANKVYWVGNSVCYRREGSKVSDQARGEQTRTLAKLTGGNPDPAPQLQNPFLYVLNENGTAGYGKIAIPYVSVQKPYRYWINGTGNPIPSEDRAGMVFANSDDVVRSLYVSMEIQRSVDSMQTQVLNSNTVNIPAYHKIHDFAVTSYSHKGASGLSFVNERHKQISWKIYHPRQEELMENDMFEIQRAYHWDYSDAETIGLIPMEYDSLTTDATADKQTYTYLDTAQAAWWNPVENNYKIYYRVRRVSSSQWGWIGHEFVASGAFNPERNYYPAPFLENGTAGFYTPAADFEQSRQLELTIRLFAKETNDGNGSVTKPAYERFYWDENQVLRIRKVLKELGDTIYIEVPNDSIRNAFARLRNSPYSAFNSRDYIDVRYTDVVNTPCVHYEYAAVIDTADVKVKKLYASHAYTEYLPVTGEDLYFTEAANLRTFTATKLEYSDGVLLRWETTEGNVGSYKIETRPAGKETEWTVLEDNYQGRWYKDQTADPTVSPEWEYRLTMTYECNGNIQSDEAVAIGSRNPYGKVSGYIRYEDESACPGVTVTASLTGSGSTVQTVVTDEDGYYLLDSLLYGGGYTYSIQPTGQTAEFRFNNTSSQTATVTLGPDNSIRENIHFTNISSVPFSGRVLFENSTVPVRDVQFLLNGVPVKNGTSYYKTDASGKFEFCVPKNSAFTLQAYKEGHTFAGDGFVRVANEVTGEEDSLITLAKRQPAVRIYDRTKVRLIGRLSGGHVQANKPLGFGLSRNNLGDDLKMVFELEGDNISQIVHYPDDLLKDSVTVTFRHEVRNGAETDSVGVTRAEYYKKRIIIYPDVNTGEYYVDLFPVKYKITQATAKGYATLYAEGKTGGTIDLTEAPLHQRTNTLDGKEVDYNESYNITYHSPISVSCTQLLFGMPLPYYGEKTITRQNIRNQKIEVPVVERQADGSYSYLFGAPVFNSDTYQFRVTAQENYYYNNEPTSARHETVRLQGGTLKVYNGLYDAPNTEIQTHELDTLGQAVFTIPIDYVSFIKTGEEALRVLDLSVEYQGAYIESQALRAYVTGDRLKGQEYTASTHGDVVLLDVLRDPPGTGSSAYLEAGSSYSYTCATDFKLTFGLDITLKYGAGANIYMGAFAGMGGGVWTGMPTEVASNYSLSLPITSSFVYKHNGTYTFTTSERITTSSDFLSVGADADVFIGATQNVLYGAMDAVQPLDSLTYVTLAARAANGTMRTIAEGRDASGQKYYLVIGTELGAKSYISSTFVHTQSYIERTLLPQLIQQRDALLMTGDSATVASIAVSTGKPAYWSKVSPEDENFGMEGYYEMILPDNSRLYDDEVAAYNRQYVNWFGLLIKNEHEKIDALRGSSRELVGTWSMGGATTVTHSESYNSTSSVYAKFTYPGLSLNTALPKGDATMIMGEKAGMDKLMQTAFKQKDTGENKPLEVLGKTASATWKFEFTPIFNMDWNMSPATSSSSKTKSTGFTLKGDDFAYEHINVSVYRVVDKNDRFNDATEENRDFTDAGNKYRYGSYVYFLNGGATRCPWEGPDSTRFYTPKVPLSAGTLKLENPKLDIDIHERSNVPVDQPAVFYVRLSNESEVPYGDGPIKFNLRLQNGCNPKGAKIMIDGEALLEQGRDLYLTRANVITKRVEVYAGEGYDFENLTLALMSSCSLTELAKCTFSVHYMPVACPVNISAPHADWIMNTLSPQDSTGWYLPVVIDGFDVNYKNFDHIEFQYKLATRSDEDWVNLCSYYAEDSLYELASGNKAMIHGGRIENVRFYGERDPMEQQYDLRAVAFCRHGNGFITRASEVIRGIKDTRPPRVFGEPEPADAILGVGDNFKLRFNEPIAGNYLDEDNNFQITGYTNESGITTGTSLHFDGTEESYAESKVLRSFLNKSFSIDMMIRPTDANKTSFPFIYRSDKTLTYLVLSQNMLGLGYNLFGGASKSLPIPEPMTSFTRVVVTYDHTTRKVRYFVGTQEITDPNDAPFKEGAPVSSGSAPICLGKSFEGNMMEVRLWSKALTPEEIAETHMRRLTGYEKELIAYYPMNEGIGDVVYDKATGATLYTHGATWEHQKGISLRLEKDQPVRLDDQLMSRSSKQDETLMFWFKTAGKGTLFTAGRTDETQGTEIAVTDGGITLYSDNAYWTLPGTYDDDEWHHFALAVNRTYNNVAVYVDDHLKQTFAATKLGAVSGSMYLGGKDFEGHIDQFAVFEQALPKSLLESFGTISPSGDEMGLMAYLPFQEMKENGNGIYEQVFSVNDQRIRTVNGTVVDKKNPVILDDPATLHPDRTQCAPVSDMGKLTKMNFDWAFNGDELLVNLNMQDREINKQTIYVTVRDVEDLNGNPMVSPVTWTAFVDKNALKWEERTIRMHAIYGEETNGVAYVTRVINHSGKRHPYSIESLPEWLTVNAAYGTINPTEELYLTFSANTDMAPGVYEDIVYVTDENGLSEPMRVELTIEAVAPYEEIDEHKYPLNMSVCAQVKLNDTEYDTDPNDIVYAFYQNECVGMDHVSFNESTHKSKVFLTVHGVDEMNRKPIRFQLWQASTGRVFDLTTNRNVIFAHGFVYNCGDTDPLILTTYGSEMQAIELEPGWNWISVNLDLKSSGGKLANCLTANEPWTEGDQIKNPHSRLFSTYSETSGTFVGTLDALHYSNMYMVYSQTGNTMRISGDTLAEDSMKIKVRGDGQWSLMPCLFNRTTPISEALAGYFQYAKPGDLIKAHNRFATFSEDKRWEGNLTALRPGEGYLFRRLGLGTVEIPFYHQTTSHAPKRAPGEKPKAFTNAHAAANMTMIAKVQGEHVQGTKVMVYAGDELAGVAEPIDSIYFITIQSDKVGEALRFETEDGTPLRVQTGNDQMTNGQMVNVPDAHHGTLKAPVILIPTDASRPYKVIENNHVVIIRNNEKYDVTGKKL